MLMVGHQDTFYTSQYGFEKGLARMREHGYGGIDYQGFLHTNTPLFEKSPREFELELKRQYEVIQKEGLLVHQTHGPWRHPPQDATVADREERFEKMARSIEGTAMLGCNKMILHPLMPFSSRDEGHEKETYEMNLEFMQRICKVAREHKVYICFENMPMKYLSLATVEETLDFVKTINDKYFRMCLDTGHCAVRGGSPAEAVRLIGKEYLFALHVHDNDGEKDRHWSPFTGVIDWEAFGKALHEIQYEGVISLEVKKSGKLPEELREHEEIGLFRKGEYLAKLASGQYLSK